MTPCPALPQLQRSHKTQRKSCAADCKILRCRLHRRVPPDGFPELVSPLVTGRSSWICSEKNLSWEHFVRYSQGLLSCLYSKNLQKIKEIEE